MKEKEKNIAIIFAGGKGERMGADIPKQFLKIYGKEIIVHTLEKFQYNDNIDLIYVGCINEFIPELEGLVKKYNIGGVLFATLFAFVTGNFIHYPNIICRKIINDNPINYYKKWQDKKLKKR